MKKILLMLTLIVSVIFFVAGCGQTGTIEGVRFEIEQNCREILRVTDEFLDGKITSEQLTDSLSELEKELKPESITESKLLESAAKIPFCMTLNVTNPEKELLDLRNDLASKLNEDSR